MSALLFALVLTASYAIIGAGIKFLDHETDYPNRLQPQQIKLWVVTIALAFIINIWIFYDIFTAVLGLGIVLGLIATYKVNNPYFLFLTVAIIPLGIFRIVVFPVLLYLLLILALVFLASILDEILHSKTSNIKINWIHWIFEHRPCLKFIVLILPFFGYLTFIHTIAFWVFDIVYDLTAHLLGAFLLPHP